MEIKLENLSKFYTKNKKDLRVIENFNYTFTSSKIYLIKGSSGSGKTTILSLIGLLDKETSGEIYFNNEKVNKLSNYNKTEIRNKKIGFIFQDYNLLEGLTIEENIILNFIDSDIKLKSLNEKVDKILEQLNLSHRKGHYPFELSGGEKQRVGIARALIKEPDIIICDEPISNLDNENSKQIIEILSSLRERTSCIIIVSCHTNDFDNVADEIINF